MSPTRQTFSPSTAGFIADHATVRRYPGGKQVYWPLVPNRMQRTPGQLVTGGATAQGAVALVVTALQAPLAAGTILDFGLDEVYVTTAAAAAGATSVAIRAAPVALEGGETADVPGSGGKFLPAGTPVMEITSGTGLGKVVPRGLGALPANRATRGVLATHASENLGGDGTGKTDAISGYGIITGASVFENLLPLNVLDATVRTELLGLPGGGFDFYVYADNAAS